MLHAFTRFSSPFALLLFSLAPSPTLAWDGFDANNAALVEVEPERVPAVTDTITVRNYKDERQQTCLVEEVRHNLRTIELVVRCPDTPALRTLVMDRL